ncbi:MAG: hypothetical protein ACREBZ_05300 [Thermoplasmata archaeon]
MDGVLLLFHLPEGSSPLAHHRFRRRVYGEWTTSWGGKYRYWRKGLLDRVPHVRLRTGAILVRTKDASRLSRAIRRARGKVVYRTVRLTSSDLAVLERPVP